MATKITYRDLFAMLQRGGCTSITLPTGDLCAFKKYATKNKMIDNLNFEQLHGSFVVTRKK